MLFNNRLIKKLMAAAAALMVALTPAGGVFADKSAPADGEEAASIVQEIANYLGVYSRYDEVSANSLMRSGLLNLLEKNPELYGQVMQAMLESIDEYSEYYPPEEAQTFRENISGTVIGIGITFDMVEEGVNVVSVIRDTPASNAGLEVGDIIVSVDDVSLAGMGSEKAASYIKGEENTPLRIGVKRKGLDSVMYIDMVREKIIGTSVSSAVYRDSDTGAQAMYIRVYGFVSNTAEAFKAELDKAKEQKISNIIIDLRDNGGGIFEQAIEMADYLIPKGSVITTEDHKVSQFNVEYKAQTDDSYKFSTVVLINENSASASEVFAAALRENDCAYLIGKKSYGKGTIQSVVDLPYGDCMKYTIGYYLTPKGNNIHKVGLAPDSSIENTYTPFEIEKYQKFSFMNVYDLESRGEEVQTAKELLKIWGTYKGEINDVYDREMADAVYKFQMGTGLYPYGVLDLTTQNSLYTRLAKSKVLHDDQLDAALSHFDIKRETAK